MKPERITLRLLAAVLCLILTLSCTVSAFAAAKEKDNTLTVGVPADRCPVFYIDSETDEITGIGADLMRVAAENSGYKVEFRKIKEATLKEALDNSEYDVVMPFGSAIDSAAGHSTVVSDNLIQTPFTLVADEKRKLPPFNKLRVGMLTSQSGVAETVRKRYPRLMINMYDTMSDCVKALRGGKVDALLHNSYVWSYVLQKPAYSDLVVQPSNMFSMDFRVGALDTPEGNAIISRLNEGIAKLTDTRRQAITLDYTSRRLYKYDFSDYIYEYGLIILLGALLIIALIIITLQKIYAMRKEHEEKIRELVDNDPLTGVLSVTGFIKRAEELLRTHPDTPYFLSYNNIRDFKFINDSLGRDAGDELLKFWAKKSTENLNDEEAIGRIAADRFAVLRHISSDEQMRSDEKNVLEPVHNFFINQGMENRVQLCSGIYVLTPKDFRNIDVEHMLDLARVAEKRVRESREGDFAFYNPEQWEKGKRIADVVNYLPSALQAGDIQVWYQPQVNYDTGDITGAEALCRWKHTNLGWLQPAEFISTLEEAGLIYDLDKYVWDKACRNLKKWNELGQHRSVSVNVSRSDIREDRDIPEHFKGLIQKYDLTPDQLRIEITETAYVENPSLLIRTTERLRSFGFQVEMDDFGSGYSSLHMLKEVPIDCIKLDLHFLTASGDPEKSRTIVSSMISMMRQLNIELITEGVETDEQARFIKSKGGCIMQGYYFYKPMPVEDFEKIIGISQE